MKPRIVRVDDFVAEEIEGEAARLPPSKAGEAKILLEHAASLRASRRTRYLRVWEYEANNG